MVREGNSKVVQEESSAGWRGVVGGEFENPCVNKTFCKEYRVGPPECI